MMTARYQPLRVFSEVRKEICTHGSGASMHTYACALQPPKALGFWSFWQDWLLGEGSAKLKPRIERKKTGGQGWSEGLDGGPEITPRIWPSLHRD